MKNDCNMLDSILAKCDAYDKKGGREERIKGQEFMKEHSKTDPLRPGSHAFQRNPNRREAVCQLCGRGQSAHK